jgi:hypothetical protein
VYIIISNSIRPVEISRSSGACLCTCDVSLALADSFLFQVLRLWSYKVTLNSATRLSLPASYITFSTGASTGKLARMAGKGVG